MPKPTIDDEFAVKEFIYTYPLDKVADELRENGWLDNDIAQACKLYRAYIFLRFKHPKLSFPPSFEIDQVWKCHISHTENYRRFCNHIFKGQYLDRNYQIISNQNSNKVNSLFNEVTRPLFLEDLGIVLEIYPLNNLRNWSKYVIKKIGKTLYIGTAGLALLLTFGKVIQEIIYWHDKQINQTYMNLIDSVRNVSIDEGEFYLLCHSDELKKYRKFRMQKLYGRHLMIEKHLRQLVRVAVNMEFKKQMEVSTREILGKFGSRANDLYNAELRVCSEQLVSTEELDKQRKSTDMKIWATRKKHLWL